MFFVTIGSSARRVSKEYFVSEEVLVRARYIQQTSDLPSDSSAPYLKNFYFFELRYYLNEK